MTTTTAPALSLWTRRQLRTLLAADLVAVGVILFGAWRAGEARDTQPAIAWLIVAVLGLGLSGLVHGSWIARNRRLVRSSVAALPQQVRAILSPGAATDTVSEAADLVAVQGSLRYHRRDCALAAGREVIVLSAEDETLAARYPCEVCRP